MLCFGAARFAAYGDWRSLFFADIHWEVAAILAVQLGRQALPTYDRSVRAQWLVKCCCVRSKLLEDMLVWLLEARGCIAYPISPLYAAGHPLHHIERHYFRPAGYWMVFSAGCFVVAGVLSAFIGPSFLFSTCKSFDSAPSNLWTVKNSSCTSPFSHQ